MPTPAFVPQPATLPTAVRYYTALDPYHYTVDNRPMTDLETNILAFGTQGIDSARRANLIHELATARRNQDVLDVPSNGYVEGLKVSYSGGSLGIQPGSLFVLDSVYSGSSLTMVKQAILVATSGFAMTAPGGVGTSVDFLIQVRFKYLATSISSNIPYFDSASSFIPSGVLVGELEVSSKSGTAAASGTQVTPTADAGWLPLYAITFINGTTNPISVRMATGAPSVRKMHAYVPYIGSSFSNPPTSNFINGVTVPQFRDGETNSIGFGVGLRDKNPSPYLPIRLKLTYRSDAASGNIDWEGYISALNVGGLASDVLNYAVESLPANPVIARTSSNVNGTTSIVLTPEFFGTFISNVWSVNAEGLLINLRRLGATDSHTGNVDLLQVELIQ